MGACGIGTSTYSTNCDPRISVYWRPSRSAAPSRPPGITSTPSGQSRDARLQSPQTALMPRSNSTSPTSNGGSAQCPRRHLGADARRRGRPEVAHSARAGVRPLRDGGGAGAERRTRALRSAAPPPALAIGRGGRRGFIVARGSGALDQATRADPIRPLVGVTGTLRATSLITCPASSRMAGAGPPPDPDTAPATPCRPPRQASRYCRAMAMTGIRYTPVSATIHKSGVFGVRMVS